MLLIQVQSLYLTSLHLGGLHVKCTLHAANNQYISKTLHFNSIHIYRHIIMYMTLSARNYYTTPQYCSLFTGSRKSASTAPCNHQINNNILWVYYISNSRSRVTLHCAQLAVHYDFQSPDYWLVIGMWVKGRGEGVDPFNFNLLLL